MLKSPEKEGSTQRSYLSLQGRLSDFLRHTLLFIRVREEAQNQGGARLRQKAFFKKAA